MHNERREVALGLEVMHLLRCDGRAVGGRVRGEDDANVLGDGLGGLGVVTRDHDDADAGLVARLHGAGHGGAGGILEGEKTAEDNLGLIRSGVGALEQNSGIVLGVLLEVEALVAVGLGARAGLELLRWEEHLSERKDTLSLLGEDSGGLEELGVPLLVEGLRLTVDHNVRALGEDTVEAALEVPAVLVPVVQLAGLEHPLVLAAEGHLTAAALEVVVIADVGHVVDAGLRELEQSSLRSITHDIALLNWHGVPAHSLAMVVLAVLCDPRRRAAERSRLEECLAGLVLVVEVSAFAIGGEDLVVVPRLNNCHLVLCERACLVGANHGRGAQRLYGLHVLHKHLHVLHAASSQCQRHRDGAEQTLRNVGNNNTNREDDVVHRELAAVGHDAEAEEEDAENNGDDGDDVDEAVELLAQGRVLLLRLRHESVHAPHHSVVTSADANTHGPTAGDARAKHGNVIAAEGGLALGHHTRFLGDLIGLSGEGRLRDFEIFDVHEAEVGRDLVAELEDDDVAGDELRAINHLNAAVATDATLVTTELLELVHEGAGGGLLLRGECSGDQDDEPQNDAEVEVGRVRGKQGEGDEAERTADLKHEGEGGHQLHEELDEERRLGLRRQGVLAKAFAQLFNSLGGETPGVLEVGFVELGRAEPAVREGNLTELLDALESAVIEDLGAKLGGLGLRLHIPLQLAVGALRNFRLCHFYFYFYSQ
eukprot:PhM_4_TR9493/c0_g1_i1/m.26031